MGTKIVDVIDPVATGKRIRELRKQKRIGFSHFDVGGVDFDVKILCSSTPFSVGEFWY